MRLLQRFLLPALVATVVLSLSVPAAMAKAHHSPKAHAAGKAKPPKKPPKNGGGSGGGGGTSGTVADTGTRDFSYAGPSAPTGQKPQSKLWFNDGSWWGVLYNSAGTIATGKGWHIYRFDWDANLWVDTGVRVDTRARAELDALWSNGKLYLTANIPPGTQATDTRGLFSRYSYDPITRTYTQDAGFPVTLEGAPVEALVMDRDSTGKLWATWTLDNADGSARTLYVTHTTTDDTQWVTPYTPNVTGATGLDPDDISSVVAFNGKIGVMWSNQRTWNMYFAVHRDGDPDSRWTPGSASSGDQLADDHMNLKALTGDAAGDVVAVWKTSLNAPTDPLIVVGIRNASTGRWKTATFGTVADDHTRELVMVDREHRMLYVFASSPCCNGGIIYYKKASLASSTFSFPSGKGTPFIASTANPNINNPASTKQDVSSATGLLVIAADDSTHYYLHNTLELGASTGVPTTAITDGPTGEVASMTAKFAFTSTPSSSRFECSLDGATFTTCKSGVTYSALSNGQHTFKVRGVNGSGTDQTPATRIWTVNAIAPDAPVITTPADGATLTVTGSGFFVNGTALPESTVDLYDNGVLYATRIADATGNWSKWTTVTSGVHTFTARVTNAAGNTSALSAPVTVRVNA